MKYLIYTLVITFALISPSQMIAQDQEVLAKFGSEITNGNSDNASFKATAGYHNIKSISWGTQRSIPEGAKDMQRSQGETAFFSATMIVENFLAYSNLFAASTAGTLIPEIEILYLCSSCASHNNEPYRTTKFEDVIITSVAINPEDIGQVEISFDATKITREYRRTNSSGALNTTTSMTYDIEAGG